MRELGYETGANTDITLETEKEASGAEVEAELSELKKRSRCNISHNRYYNKKPCLSSMLKYKTRI
jgi:hypothetical protein